MIHRPIFGGARRGDAGDRSHLPRPPLHVLALVPFLLLFLAVPLGAQERTIRFSRYATVEAKVVGLQVEGRWICPDEAVGICDRSSAAPPEGADMVGSVSSFSYDRDGFGRGDFGEIRVDIGQPSIFDPFSITNRVTRWEFKASRWKELVLTSLRRGYRTDELAVDDDTTVDATLWFLHLPIEVQLTWQDDPGFFSRNEVSRGYGRVRVLIRLEPQTDRSVYLRESDRDPARFRLENLYMGPHAVEAAAVSHWGSRGRNAPGTTGLRWNAGAEQPLAHDPSGAWGYPLAAEELQRIRGSASAPGSGRGVLPGPGRERSWFNRPIYFTVDLTRLEASRQEMEVGGGDRERRWVGDQAFIDAAIHTYVIGEWTNRPVDVVETGEQGPVQIEDRSWRALLAGLTEWVPRQLRWIVLLTVLGIAGLLVAATAFPRIGYALGSGIRNFFRGLRGL